MILAGDCKSLDILCKVASGGSIPPFPKRKEKMRKYWVVASKGNLDWLMGFYHDRLVSNPTLYTTKEKAEHDLGVFVRSSPTIAVDRYEVIEVSVSAVS